MPDAKNIILNTDSYKASHYLQYPPDATRISSYIESRGGRFEQTLFFGLQMFLQAYLSKPITDAHIAEAADVLGKHGLPFNEAGWRHIQQKHRGFLPLRIEAVAEGSVVPVGNAMVQVVNTDPQCAWLPGYLETALLRAVWYPTTVATISYHCRQRILQYLNDTAESSDAIAFKLHDFGARGATTEEAAAIGGAAHLVNFMGSDTLSGILAARHFYGADMAGFSIPAAEHSTITSWGRTNEAQAYANMLDQFAGPGKIVAVVSDSYDLWYAIDHIWGDTLKQRVETTGGTLVIRPDSGNPVEVVAETIERLMQKFGYRTNSKGYRVLPDYIRVIQGDGINEKSIADILQTMKARQQSAENITFGMGAALLQRLDRDTLKFAMKASAVEINGIWHDVYKDPITDHSKRSKKGRLALVKDSEGEYKTVAEEGLPAGSNLLQPVFENGTLLKTFSFEEVRQRALAQ